MAMSEQFYVPIWGGEGCDTNSDLVELDMSSPILKLPGHSFKTGPKPP